MFFLEYRKHGQFFCEFGMRVNDSGDSTGPIKLRDQRDHTISSEDTEEDEENKTYGKEELCGSEKAHEI